MCVLLTVNNQRLALCKEGFGLFCLWPLARIDGVLRHQFEKVKEELVKGAASLKILGIMGSQLEKKSDEHAILCQFYKALSPWIINLFACIHFHTLKSQNQLKYK